MKLRIQEAWIEQHVTMDVDDAPDVERDGVRITPTVVSVHWRWVGNEDESNPDTGLATFRISAVFIGPRRGDALEEGPGSLEFKWGEPDFPQGDLSKWIQENQPYTTGALVPAALRWEQL